MILSVGANLLGGVGKAILGSGKKIARGVKDQAKKVSTDKFLNKQEKKKTYSRPEGIPHVSGTNITLSSNLSSDEVPQSNEVKDIIGDMRNVVGDIKSILEKDRELDTQEAKDRKFNIRRMFARAREKFLEKLPKPVKPNLTALKNVPMLQKLQKFIRTVLVGGLLTFLYENLDTVFSWIKGFVDVVTPVIKLIVWIGKGLVKLSTMIPPFFMENKDLGEDKVDELSKNYEGIEDEANKIKGEWERWEPEEPGQENGPTETKKETPKETPEETKKETPTEESNTTTIEKTVNNRFDMETGKTFINEKEVPLDEYKEFMNLSKAERLEKHGIDVQKMNKGGVVPGSGNTDTVPAMLTPGEFVMSKGAVQKYGEKTLASMNAAAGGTNKPTVMRGYNEGGAATPMSTEDLVAIIGPSMEIWMEQHNAAIDNDPDAIFGEHMRVSMDRDGKIPDFGKTIANMSEWAFNQGVKMTQENESIPAEVKEAVLKKMMFIRRETLDNPNFKGDIAFDINKDIPGTAANRLFLKAQADTMSPAAKAGFSAEERARLMNRSGYFGGGLVPYVQYLTGGGSPLTVHELMKRSAKGQPVPNITQQETNAMAESFDNRPMARIQKLRNERSAMDRGSDGKLSRKDRKRWNQIGAEIHAIQSQIIESQRGTSTPTQTSTSTQIPVNEKKKGGGLFGGLKRVVGGTADQLTGNLFDFDKRSGGGLIRKTADAVGGLFDRSQGDLDIEKSTTSSSSDVSGSNIKDIVDKQQDNKSLKSISTYDEDFDSSEVINVPIPLPSSNAPSSQGGGGMIPIPVGASSRTLLNRYYKEQLLSFLYKV